MKGRAIKLREAHKASSPAFCSVAWAPGGQHVVTASAAEVAILIHDAAAVSATMGLAKLYGHLRDKVEHTSPDGSMTPREPRYVMVKVDAGG